MEEIVQQAKQGDVKAMDKILTENQGMVYTVVKKFKNISDLDIDDLMQEGNIGLIKAVRNFDDSKASFCTCAYVYITQSVSLAIRKYGRLVSINRSDWYKFKNTRKISVQDYEHSDSREAIKLPEELATADSYNSVECELQKQGLKRLFIKHLTAKQREVLEAVLYSDETRACKVTKEIAKKLNCSVSNASHIYRTAVNKIRGVL